MIQNQIHRNENYSHATIWRFYEETETTKGYMRIFVYFRLFSTRTWDFRIDRNVSSVWVCCFGRQYAGGWENEYSTSLLRVLLLQKLFIYCHWTHLFLMALLSVDWKGRCFFSSFAYRTSLPSTRMRVINPSDSLLSEGI